MGKLTARGIENLKAPGLYADGNGLHLQIGKGVARSWIFRFSLRGKTRDMGLGSAGDEAVTLAGARELAAAARRLKAQGVDPIEHRKQQQAAARVEAVKAITLGECAEAYIKAHEAEWTADQARKYRSLLRKYASAITGLPVQSIDTALVLKAIEPHWRIKPKAMAKLRALLENVLDYAVTRELRDKNIANPARWKGHLSHSLPKPTKMQPTTHFAALDYSSAVPSLVERLSQKSKMGEPRRCCS